ncbi:MAG: hypothetical protein ACKV2T_38645 [Kofleriaceae bacterium]
MGRRPSIAQCDVCTQLEQSTKLDYRSNDKRPAAYATLETVARTGETDDEGSGTICGLHRCVTCGTYYASLHYVLHNDFMCPSYDEETIRRLSPDAALAALAESSDAGLAPKRAELASSKQAVIADLAEMLVEQRAPTWHLQRHAVECVIDAWLPDAARLELVLAHQDSVVRADAAHEVLELATATSRQWTRRWTPPAHTKFAHYLSQKGRPQRTIETVLDEPPRKTFRSDRVVSFYAADTHGVAVDACNIVAMSDLPLGSLFERLLSLLGGDRILASVAQNALGSVVGHHPELKPRVRAVIARLSPARQAESYIQSLSEKAAP